MTKHDTPVEARFWAKVDRRAPDECWPWTGGRNNVTGYGMFATGKHSGLPAQLLAHRYSAFIAGMLELPSPRLHVDHECHNGTDCPPGPCAHRLCVNPAHLVVKSARENLNASHNSNAQKSHCPHGHEYTAENTRWRKIRKGKYLSTARACIACDRARKRKHPEPRVGEAADAAKKGKSMAERAANLTAVEKAEVARFGIHDDEVAPEFRDVDVREAVATR